MITPDETSNEYERSLLDAAYSVLDSDDVVIEAGGGLGYVANRIRRWCCEVWTVEADPIQYQTLLANVRQWPNCYAVCGALGLSNSTKPFYRLPRYPESSSLVQLSGAERIQVSSVDINELIREANATVLVLDVEGYEYDLIRGIKNPGQLRAIVVEWHLGNDEGPAQLLETARTMRNVGFTARLDMEMPYTPTVVFRKV